MAGVVGFRNPSREQPHAEQDRADRVAQVVRDDRQHLVARAHRLLCLGGCRLRLREQARLQQRVPVVREQHLEDERAHQRTHHQHQERQAAAVRGVEARQGVEVQGPGAAGHVQRGEPRVLSAGTLRGAGVQQGLWIRRGPVVDEIPDRFEGQRVLREDPAEQVRRAERAVDESGQLPIAEDGHVDEEAERRALLAQVLHQSDPAGGRRSAGAGGRVHRLVAHGIPVHVVAEHPAVPLIERLQEDDREGVIGRGGPDVEFRKSPAPDRRFEVRLACGRHPLRIPDADHARIRRLRVHVVDVRVELLPRECGGGGEKAAGLLESGDVGLHAERDGAPHLL